MAGMEENRATEYSPDKVRSDKSPDYPGTHRGFDCMPGNRRFYRKRQPVLSKEGII